MYISDVVKIDNKRAKVYIDGDYAFALYMGELRKYNISAENDLKEEDYNEIKNEVLLKRAKLRTMHLLQSMDKTEAELRKKLKENYYTEDIIDKAIEYVRSYHYIDDERYAGSYVRYKQGNKSIRQIKIELQRKGIDKETVNNALEECDETEAINKYLSKKSYNKDTATKEEINKIYGYLMRKGFRGDSIKNALHNYSEYFE